MVELMLPKNSRVKKGKVWPAEKAANGKKPKPKDEAKDGEAKGKKDDGEENKPFVDKQLDKALAVIKDKLATPTASK